MSDAENSPDSLAAGRPSGRDAAWSALVPPEQWAVLRAGTATIHATGASSLLAGALALATYTGHWRNTKDIDVIIKAADRQRAVAALQAAGFSDYYEREAYDRAWIFRGFKEGVIFDVIWALPNHRVEIDDAWFEHAATVTLRDRIFHVAPAEEIVRVKLYVMQRERCDWVDVLNVLAATVEDMDWPRLVARMGRDLPLLHGALAIFNWMCPGRAQRLPSWLRRDFALPAIATDDATAMEARRVALFDTRPWFALHQPLDQPLPR